jgi:hypothetical protein
MVVAVVLGIVVSLLVGTGVQVPSRPRLEIRSGPPAMGDTTIMSL